MVFNLRQYLLPAGMLKNKITLKVLNCGIKQTLYNWMSEAL